MPSKGSRNNSLTNSVVTSKRRWQGYMVREGGQSDFTSTFSRPRGKNSPGKSRGKKHDRTANFSPMQMTSLKNKL